MGGLTRCQKSLLREVRPQAGLKRDEPAQRGGFVQVKIQGRIQGIVLLS